MQDLFPSPLPQIGLLALSTSLAPGANSLLIAASSAQFGMRRSLPTLAGMYTGFGAMFVATGLGAGAMFDTLPWLLTLLKWVGAAYVLYLAHGLLRARWHDPTCTKPIGFAGAALLQFLYPKLWLMAIAAIALCTGSDAEGDVSVGQVVFFVAMTLPGMLLYLRLGRVLQALATSPRVQVLVNRALATLTAASALILLMPG